MKKAVLFAMVAMLAVSVSACGDEEKSSSSSAFESAKNSMESGNKQDNADGNSAGHIGGEVSGETTEQADNADSGESSASDNVGNENFADNNGDMNGGDEIITQIGSMTSPTDITLYRVDDSELYVVIESEDCAKLKGIEEWEFGERYYNLSAYDPENGQGGSSLYLSNLNGSVSWSDESGIWNMKGEAGKRPSITKNSVVSLITVEGSLREHFSDTMQYTLICAPQEDVGEYGAYICKEGYLRDICKDISHAELEILLAERKQYEKENYLATKAAKANWAGIYQAEAYSEHQGYAVIDVTNGGALDVQAVIDGVNYDFILEETDYGSEEDEYGKRVWANASASDYDSGIYVNMYYSAGDYSSQINISYQDATNGIDLYTYGTKVNDHKVTVDDKDYDENSNLEIFRKDSEDATYFEPETSDYMYVYNNSNYYTDASGDYKQYEIIGLYSYDENGAMLSSKAKMIYPSAELAQRYYDELQSYGYDMAQYHMYGNIIYSDYYGYNNEHKLFNLIGKNWKYGQHYVDAGHYSDGTKNYFWLSKPISEKEISMDAESVLRWCKAAGKRYRCITKADYDAYVSMNDGIPEIAGWTYEFYGNDYLRQIKNNVITVIADETKYYDAYFVRTYEITDDRIVITQYKYGSDVKVAFDNYMTLNFVDTIVYEYDLNNVVVE